jgi:hypothetical protein
MLIGLGSSEIIPRNWGILGGAGVTDEPPDFGGETALEGVFFGSFYGTPEGVL